jgi:hypothetical protein
MSEEEDRDEGEGEGEIPFVVIAKIADVAAWMPDGLGKKFGHLACWFLLEQDGEMVGLFDRVPEDPMSKGQVAAILGGLRAFATERADELQAVLGPSDGIGLGFHADASIDKVIDSFEEDGFEIAGEIENGEVIELEEDDDELEPPGDAT